jgi:hypothetical protein
VLGHTAALGGLPACRRAPSGIGADRRRKCVRHTSQARASGSASASLPANTCRASPGVRDQSPTSQEDGLDAALREALEFMTGAVVDGKPQVVGLNNQLLDDIAEHIPDLAGEVANLRAAAAEACKPADEDETQDTFVRDFVNASTATTTPSPATFR